MWSAMRPPFVTTDRKSDAVRGMKYCLGGRKIKLHWLWIPVVLTSGSNFILVEWFIRSKSSDLGRRSSFVGPLRSANDQLFPSLSKAAELLILTSGTRPLLLPPIDFQKSQTPSFGWLNISFAESQDESQPTSLARVVRESDQGGINNDDDDDDDDDYTGHLSDEHDGNEDRCQDTSFVKKNHRPNCNSIQELGMQALIRADLASFLDSGSITDVFEVVDQGVHTQTSKFVFKSPKFRKRRDLSYSAWKHTLQDAMISAAVGHHPLVVSTYGYCGIISLAEYLPYGNVDSLAEPYDEPFCDHGRGKPMNLATIQQQPLVVANNLTVAQKLQLSLDMAEALALIHNHKDGILVHKDVWLPQFLLDSTRSHAKINDFNTAVILQFNPYRQEYCSFKSHFGMNYGVAPEDISGAEGGEERDVYRFADNMYYVLTGYDLFPDICSYKNKAQSRSVGGTSYLDPRWKDRSFGERAMADLITQIWQYKPRDRPSIGDVVRRLRFIIKQNSAFEQAMTPLKA